MMLTRGLQLRNELMPSCQYTQWQGTEDRNRNRPRYYDFRPRSALGVVLMLMTVFSVACADPPQAHRTEAREPCVVPRGGFDCGDQVKQEDNFMRFEQPGHQLP